MPKVKFCGLSQLADVVVVNEVHPEYVGLVFWPKSKRKVNLEEARELRAALDPVIKTVGVFVDATPEEVARIAQASVISIAQLHGSEDEAYIATLRRLAPGLEIWKAFEVADLSGDAVTEAFESINGSSADLVLLDAGKGCGASFDWSILHTVTRPYALAGGLSPGNVADALSVCDPLPLVLDVSSGIEKSERAADGRPSKDVDLMRAFIEGIDR